ncbi:MAG: TolC family protein [Planctomycetota bacterium]|nr:TolC family protein [Planctomycetota bacterium]
MRHAILCSTLLLFGCASPDAPPAAEELRFAAAYLNRTPVAGDATEPVPAAPARVAVRTTTEAEEIAGLVSVTADRLEALRAIAANEARLQTWLSKPVAREELETVAWLRAPSVRAARARVEAARTSIAQSTDLADLVGTYRAFVRETNTRVGPEKSRRGSGRIAPAPNIDALSGKIAADQVAIAFEHLRKTVRGVIAAAERAHADAARLAAARRILAEDVALHAGLIDVIRTRFEAGGATQSGLLAFEARLDKLRTELAILDDERAVVRARWNRLLSRPEKAPVALDTGADLPPAATPGADDTVARALEARQELRIAGLSARRAATAVRLAETMTLPRMDVGSSRFERERAGEASVQRGAVFPKPGRMVMPRSDFGVREAQVIEMRERRVAMDLHRDAVRDWTQAGARKAVFALEAARKRWVIHERRLVPLAERSFEAVRGAYEASRAGYLELLDGARLLLSRRLGRVTARREHAHARAALLEAVGVRIPEGR